MICFSCFREAAEIACGVWEELEGVACSWFSSVIKGRKMSRIRAWYQTLCGLVRGFSLVERGGKRRETN